MKRLLLIILPVLLIVGCEKKTTDVTSVIKQAAEERSIDPSSTFDVVLDFGGQDESHDTLVDVTKSVATSCDESSAKIFATNHIKKLYELASPLEKRNKIEQLVWGHTSYCSGLDWVTYYCGVWDKTGRLRTMDITVCCTNKGKYKIGNVDVL